MDYKLYKVGGAVRDKLLGKEPKDVDYLIVADGSIPAAQTFSDIQENLIELGYEIFSIKEEHWTIRTIFPKDHPTFPKLIADFQLSVEGGMTTDLRTNLIKRDFSMNAMAEDMATGEIIDYFGGKADLQTKMISCPVTAKYSFSADPIRIFRAIRFAMMMDFLVNFDILDQISLTDPEIIQSIDENRLQRELKKITEYDTRCGLEMMNILSRLNFDLYVKLTDKFKFNPVIRKIKDVK